MAPRIRAIRRHVEPARDVVLFMRTARETAVTPSIFLFTTLAYITLASSSSVLLLWVFFRFWSPSLYSEPTPRRQPHQRNLRFDPIRGTHAEPRTMEAIWDTAARQTIIISSSFRYNSTLIPMGNDILVKYMPSDRSFSKRLRNLPLKIWLDRLYIRYLIIFAKTPAPLMNTIISVLSNNKLHEYDKGRRKRLRRI